MRSGEIDEQKQLGVDYELEMVGALWDGQVSEKMKFYFSIIFLSAIFLGDPWKLDANRGKWRKIYKIPQKKIHKENCRGGQLAKLTIGYFLNLPYWKTIKSNEVLFFEQNRPDILAYFIVFRRYFFALPIGLNNFLSQKITGGKPVESGDEAEKESFHEILKTAELKTLRGNVLLLRIRFIREEGVWDL